MKKLFFLLTVGIVLLGCKKEEGEGGTSTIIGTVTTRNLNGAGEEIATYPGADEDVFIIYGTESTYYDDKISTSYDGSFEFPYLTPGEYTIFIYSECDTCPSGEEAVFKKVSISNKNEIVNAGELIHND